MSPIDTTTAHLFFDDPSTITHSPSSLPHLKEIDRLRDSAVFIETELPDTNAETRHLLLSMHDNLNFPDHDAALWCLANPDVLRTWQKNIVLFEGSFITIPHPNQNVGSVQCVPSLILDPDEGQWRYLAIPQHLCVRRFNGKAVSLAVRT